MIHGGHHASFPMEDASHVGAARRHGAELAFACGFDEVDAGRLALVITELATNLVRHARDGLLLLSARTGRPEVEVLAIDSGPGIPDLERCLHDGFSTGGTPGTGLGAVRRLAQDFDIHSAQPGGTIVLARVRAGGRAPAVHGPFSAGAVSLPLASESVCGDDWAFALDGDRAALLVADGLGHGPDAAEASAAAVDVFLADPFSSPRDLLQRIHVRLRPTRGAAVFVLQADGIAGTVRSAGAGNVVGRLVSGVSDRTLLSQHGTAGVAVRTPEEVGTPWPPHALLVVHSDGIESRWKPEVLTPVLLRDPALAGALLWRDHARTRDDATVAVLRRNGG